MIQIQYLYNNTNTIEITTKKYLNKHETIIITP